MNGITHILVGVLIQIILFRLIYIPLAIILTIILAFLSHFIVDIFSNITYHTEGRQKGDKFWLIWMMLITIIPLSLLVIITIIDYEILIFFFLGAFFSLLMDIWDWGIIRPLQKKKKEVNKDINWGENLILHRFIVKIREEKFAWLPNLSYEKRGVIYEIIIIIILSIIFLIIAWGYIIPF